jgi:hypothetical protein
MAKELQFEQSKIIFKHISMDDLGRIKSFKCDNPSIENFLITEAFISHLLREASTTLLFVENELWCILHIAKVTSKL